MFLEDKGVTFWSFGLANRALIKLKLADRTKPWSVLI
jgi:hypothetical protein